MLRIDSQNLQCTPAMDFSHLLWVSKEGCNCALTSFIHGFKVLLKCIRPKWFIALKFTAFFSPAFSMITVLMPYSSL